MSFKTRAPQDLLDLDAEVIRLSRESTETHYPTRPACGQGGSRGLAKWACGGCDYWTGYNSRTKSNRMILAHVTAKNNAEVTAPSATEHAPVDWFTPGVYPSCSCGFAPRNNEALTAHWAQYGIRWIDNHGMLKAVVIND